MGRENAIEQLRLLLQRYDFIAHLITGTTDRTVLTDQVKFSRSTVYRALDDLADAGLLIEEHGHYTPTTHCRLLYKEITTLTETATTINQSPPPHFLTS